MTVWMMLYELDLDAYTLEERCCFLLTFVLLLLWRVVCRIIELEQRVELK